MARWARREGHILRFIEYMDVGHSNGWRLDEVVPADEVLAVIDAELGLGPWSRRTTPARSPIGGPIATAPARSG